MADVLHLSIHLIILLSSLILSTAGNSLPNITDQKFIDVCVDEHNRARSEVRPSASNMLYMTWDNDLAMVANSWATKCLFKHNPVRSHPILSSVGENIWAGTSFEVKSAIQSWVNEVTDYNYDTLACSNICGHYTQVVWATTYKVGCAVMACPNGVRETPFSHRPGAIFVCNYATGGNYNTRPYKQGAPCSECVEHTCVKNLCCESCMLDWDTAQSVCGVFCKTIWIIRPFILFFIFGSVYLVQRRCPNIFAYIN